MLLVVARLRLLLDVTIMINTFCHTLYIAGNHEHNALFCRRTWRLQTYQPIKKVFHQVSVN